MTLLNEHDPVGKPVIAFPDHALGWLTAHPAAHRGLHGGSVVENTPSAVAAALVGGYAIEVDVQISRDGEAMVHHDHALGRLTEGRGNLRDITAAALARVPFRLTSDRMMTLGGLCDLVAGRSVLLVEMKSRFDRDLRLVRRVAAVLSGYRGPVAAMSFDPTLVAALRRMAPRLVRGMVAERQFVPLSWPKAGAALRRSMALFLHADETRPHFVAYRVQDLPGPVPSLVRYGWRLPLLTWTVRSAAERARASRFADQIIFEGFHPDPKAS